MESVINFILMCLVFFHITRFVYLAIAVNLLIFAVVIKKYNIKKYLIKQIKARPDEKFTYIISGMIASEMPEGEDGKERQGTGKWRGGCMLVISFVLPLLLFCKPHMFFEKYDDSSLYVRFYTVGVFNPKVIEIPEEHKGDKVVGIRGNVFRNVKSAEEIILPATIDTIRGNAFSGAKNLQRIQLPEGLLYIGGGAFEDCALLTDIVIPDSVNEMQGEVFRNCTSLTTVILPERITEIRGNTFENCVSLSEIEIPEGVARIGGHAFYGCTGLKTVTFPASLKEIGSSAFRRCDSLYEVTVPGDAYVDSRAFKESPTAIVYE